MGLQAIFLVSEINPEYISSANPFHALGIGFTNGYSVRPTKTLDR
jgi:hypothetical protein